MKTKEWTLLVAMVLVLLASAFANDNDEINQKRSEQIKERIAYFKENIKPKIDAQRNKLETSISAEDKKEINRIRVELIKQRLLENELFAEAREKRIKGEDFDEGLWEEIEAQRIVIENLHDQAKLIANKYRPEIDEMVASLREELKDQRENMNPQRDEFPGRYGRGQGRGYGYGQGRRGDGYGPGNRGGYGYGPGNQGGYGPGFHRGFGPNRFGGFGPGMFGGLNTVGFLLWDVNRG